MTQAISLETCTACGKARPFVDFISLSGRVTSTCSECRRRMTQSRAAMGLGRRAHTIKVQDMESARRHATRVHLRVVHDVDVARPKTRGECLNGPRPCPFVSCRWNLYLDVNERTGSITINHPDREPDEMDPDRSCALDIADQGGASLEDIGLALNLTRERVRQIEEAAFQTVRSRSRRRECVAELRLREFADDAGLELRRRPSFRSLHRLAMPEPFEDDPEREEPPTRVSVFAEGEQADELVADAVWQMLRRRENSRAHEHAEAKEVE